MPTRITPRCMAAKCSFWPAMRYKTANALRATGSYANYPAEVLQRWRYDRCRQHVELRLPSVGLLGAVHR
jgi:hypothetical protein